MFSYIMRRLVFGALTVVGVSIVVFVVMRILPGDPLVAIFGPEGFTKLTDQERAHYMAELGLSDPLWLQYLHWVQDIARGNFGRSFFRSESVAEMILRRGPLTAQIAFLSVTFSWLVGIPVAVISALRPNSWADNLVHEHPVPGRAGLLARHAHRADPALHWLSRAADRRVAVHRSWDDAADGHRPAIVRGLAGGLHRAHGALQFAEVIRETMRTARAKVFTGRFRSPSTRCPTRCCR
jgi:peptide/nickel transport system permease protein